MTRKFSFDSMHRVLGHKGRCRFLHGHTYKAEVTVIAPHLDSLGFIIDFGVVKQVVGDWIDTHLDHNAILNRFDPLYALWERGGESLGEGAISELFAGRAPYVINGNPTAEVLAQHLCKVAGVLLASQPGELRCSHVRLYETDNCYADYQVPFSLLSSDALAVSEFPQAVSYTSLPPCTDG